MNKLFDCSCWQANGETSDSDLNLVPSLDSPKKVQVVPLGKKQSVMLRVWGWTVPFSVKKLQTRGNLSQFTLVRFFFHKIRRKGYEPNYIIIWHRKHIFVSYRLAFRAFSYCSGVLHNWDMNDYAMCNSHCFLMLSKSVVHLLTDMTEVLKKKIGKTVYKYWIESRRVT